jgi:hypothetical protein
MKILRATIITLGVLSLVTFGALAFGELGTAATAVGRAAYRQNLVMLYTIGMVLLIITGIWYALKNGLAGAWVVGCVVLPGFIPLIMAWRNPPQRRQTWVPPARPTASASARPTPPVVAAPRTAAPAAPLEEPLSVLPRCVWTPGVGTAPSPMTWEAAADWFIETESKKDAPDFPAFRAAIVHNAAGERHGAWNRVGCAFKYRDVGAANFCWVEGLRADPDPVSANWTLITLLRGGDWVKLFPDRQTPERLQQAREAVDALVKGLRIDEAVTHDPVSDYNAAVRFMKRRVYDEAITLFDRHLDDDALGMLTFYAGGLCRRAAGLRLEIPERFADKTDDAGVYYAAANLVAGIIGAGQRAAVTRRGTSCMVKALVDDATYLVSVNSWGTSITTMAWRKADSRDLPLNDPSANPNPTAADKWVIGLAGDAPNAQPVPLPAGGIPTELG